MPSQKDLQEAEDKRGHLVLTRKAYEALKKYMTMMPQTGSTTVFYTGLPVRYTNARENAWYDEQGIKRPICY